MDLGPPRHRGVLDAAYASARNEVAELVPARARRILDVGCSTGHLGAGLRARGGEVTGVEVDADLAAEAAGRLDRVVRGDVEALAAAGDLLDSPYDCVILADVLEHLRDPWSVTTWAARLVGPQGAIVVSVPNVRHLETFWALVVRRRWPLAPVGIFDRTHLRWFARNNLEDLLAGTDLRITELTRSYRLRAGRDTRYDGLARRLGDLGTLQFIFRAERGRS